MLERQLGTKESIPKSGGIAKLLYGLSLIGIQWNELDGFTKIAIYKLFIQSNDSMPEIEAVNTIYALAKMGYKWIIVQSSRTKVSQQKTLNNEFQRSIIKSIFRVVPEMKSHALANTLWSMGKIQIIWSELPITTTTILFEQMWTLFHPVNRYSLNLDDPNKLSKLSSTMLPQTLSNTLLGLNNMRVEWNDLPKNIQSVLAYAIEAIAYTDSRLDPQAISNIFYSLGSMGTNHRHRYS